MPLPFILLPFLAIAIAANRAHYGKPKTIVLQAGQTMVISPDGRMRVTWHGEEAPAEPAQEEQ